jgi:hypothetical protein
MEQVKPQPIRLKLQPLCGSAEPSRRQPTTLEQHHFSI